MFLVIILISLGILSGVFVILRVGAIFRSDYVFAALLGGVAGFIISFVLSVVITVATPEYCTNSKETPLNSLSDSSITQGHFYLGAGYFNQEAAFFYSIREADGGFTIHTIPARLAEVYQTSDGQPRVNTFTVEVDPHWAWAIIFPPSGDCDTHFFVPPGSINNSYQVG